VDVVYVLDTVPEEAVSEPVVVITEEAVARGVVRASKAGAPILTRML